LFGLSEGKEDESCSLVVLSSIIEAKTRGPGEDVVIAFFS